MNRLMFHVSADTFTTRCGATRIELGSEEAQETGCGVGNAHRPLQRRER